ncbi:cytochrome P450 [Burkholderia sp. BCC1988]|uniref:cytochrome P450 n=1 Tax=Burkholderia sp. BCC1988 TaxID=2817443 RepID=UPI002AB1498C|nr:cytochrome P450 [Burkholderia sp. BCC1988]
MNLFSAPDITSSEFLSDRYASYRMLRDKFPQFHTEIDGESTIIFTRFADVAELLKNPVATNQREPGTFPEGIAGNGPAGRFYRESLVNMDGIDHTVLRRIMSPAFSPAPVQKMRVWMEAVAERHLARFDGESEMDFVSAFASPMAAEVASGLAHVPAEIGAKMLSTAPDLMKMISVSSKTRSLLDRADSAGAFCYAHMTELFDSLKDKQLPLDDTVAVLLAAEGREKAMTRSTLITLLLGYMMAGYHTAMITMANAVVALLTHPEQRARLVDAPELAGSAWEEVLRYDGAVHFRQRYASAAITVGGSHIKKGQRLLLGLQSANRDERQFQDPDRFLIDRPNNRHLAFGSGAHFCMGLQVARLEGEIVLRRFFRRFPRMEIVDMERSVQDLTFPMLTRLTLSLR